MPIVLIDLEVFPVRQPHPNIPRGIPSVVLQSKLEMTFIYVSCQNIVLYFVEVLHLMLAFCTKSKGNSSPSCHPISCQLLN